MAKTQTVATMTDVAALREAREAINMEIVALQASLRPIAARIRELEGPAQAFAPDSKGPTMGLVTASKE